MKKLIETLKNIYKIEDLRKRIGVTLFFILIYRLGSFVVLPGIDPAQLGALKAQTQEGLLGLLDMFSGGAFSNASVFALGIMPYITASIIIQLLTIAVPYFQRLQKEGESGRNKMNQITRWLTVVILLFQGPAFLTNIHLTLNPEAFVLTGRLFDISSTIIMLAGSMFVLWLGEKITDRGIGNGVSILIMIGIIARLPQSVLQEFISRIEDQGGGMVLLLIEIVVLFVVFMLVIMLEIGRASCRERV